MGAMTVPERWGLYAYTYGPDQKAVVRFDHQAATEPAPATHGSCVRLIAYVPLEQVQRSGLPQPEANAVLGVIEDRVVQAVQGPEHRLVGVMTYGGMRDFVIQTDAPEELTAALEAVDSPYRKELRQSAGWDFFDRKIRPDDYGWHFQSNIELLEQLRQAGSRMEEPHSLDHSFVGPAEALAHLRSQLEADAFVCSPAASTTSVTLTKEASLEPESLSKLTVALGRFAQSVGARYDGWGTHVVR